jgi:hypothetical protein
MTCFPPRGQSSDDDERVESIFPQLQRHPGAGRFACSSTVDVNILIFWEGFDLLSKVVGFNANGSLNA